MIYELTLDTDDDCGLTYKTRRNTAFMRIGFESRDEKWIQRQLLIVATTIKVDQRGDGDDSKRKASYMRTLLDKLREANEKKLTEFHGGGNIEVTFKEIQEPMFDFMYRSR